ncbi:U6 snRNA phosphodiesterase 1 isoform X2 [Halyomorpha halys]|uniref:U6 snRNA phosphodiesterase 1 isoform X2 n=1 Tax=Halyomorpha halys TaxID=286706 RepID=UPI0034D2B67B
MLPLPEALKCVETEHVEDDPTLHDGRSRSFPHKRGNWTSLIYIPYKETISVDHLFDQLYDICSPGIRLIKVKEPHVSLTKTFVLLYHWIKEFHLSIKEKLKVLDSYEICFDGIEVYCNEDQSRTFLGLTVGMGKTEIASSVQLFDECLKEYRLEPFYEEGSFHMSIAWCHGNKKTEVKEKLLIKKSIIDILSDKSAFSISVNAYVFKTGFKEFILNLQ